MASNKILIMNDFMRKVENGIIPKPQDYNLSSTELWEIVDMCQKAGLIEGATHADVVLFLDKTKLTLKGLQYLQDHSSTN